MTKMPLFAKFVAPKLQFGSVMSSWELPGAPGSSPGAPKELSAGAPLDLLLFLLLLPGICAPGSGAERFRFMRYWPETRKMS